MNSAHPGPYAGIPVWLRPITRRPGEVQFGVLEGGPIVAGVSPDEARLLARLDGTMPAEALAEVAGASGVSKRRWRVLIDLVVRLGLLEPGPVVRVQSGPDGPGGGLLVEGFGTLASDLARLLRHGAGLAVVHDDREGSSHRPGEPPASPAAGPLGPSQRPDRPVLAILVSDIAIDPRRGDIWLARGVPHLPVVTTGSRAVVGPYVDGTPPSPCLWCLDLHRSDRDQTWPTVMAQVATLPPGSAHPSASGASPGLAELVAGTVAALVARSAAGDRPPPGVAVEVSLPWPRLDHRRWRPHPLCRNEHVVRTAATRHGSRP